MMDVIMLALGPWLCSPRPSPTPTRASCSKEITMGFDYALAAIVTVGLLVYLTYALLRPERF